MKKKICLALSMLMIMTTLFTPVSAWAQPDYEKTGEQAETVVNADDGFTIAKKSDSKSKKKSHKSKKKSNSSRNSKAVTQTVTVPQNKDEFSILFTNDIHSHLDGFNVNVNGKTKEHGGFARLASIFKNVSRTYKEDSFVLDAGDFSMGTAYQSVFREEAAELRMMGYLGYDAVTLGNHDLDFGPDGLSEMIENAGKLSKDENYELPKIVASNIDWEKTLSESKDPAAKLQSQLEKEYVILEKNDIKIAVFGLFGKDALKTAPECGVSFEDPIAAAERIVGEIKKKEKDVTLIVCLSHGGMTQENYDEQEDAQLAKSVPDIDLIISGHSHEVLDRPVTVGNTVIGSAGCFTENVGHVTYKKDEKTEEYAMSEYEMIRADSTVQKDSAANAELNKFKDELNEKYFSRYGFKADQVLTNNRIEFTAYEEFGKKQGEDPFGSLLADSYVYAVKKAEGKDSVPVDVAVVPQGVVRAVLPLGEITAGDVFNILSTGEGEDGLAGYPLISAYLTGKELKNIAEIDATISEDVPYARIYTSGLTYRINPNRLKLNRAFDIMLGNGKDLQKIEKDKLYRVVTDMYTAKMLAGVTEESKGILSINPKNEDGTPIIHYEDNIIKKGKSELKAWGAVATYLERKDNIPSKYKEPQGRKTVSDSKSIRELICQPNRIGWLVRLAILIPILIILLILIIIWLRRHRRRSNMMFSISEREKKAIFAPPKKQKNLFAGNSRRGRRNRRNGRF